MTDKSDTVEKSEPSKLVSNQTSSLAWIELACVILLNMSINLRWLTFSPIATIASEYMDVEISDITWLANCATLIYMGISASTGWIFEKYGMKTCVSFSSVCSRGNKLKKNCFSFFWLLLQILLDLGLDISLHLLLFIKDMPSSCLVR